MASQILLQFVAEYMYRGDAKAERHGALLTLNRELLDELLGSGALRELLDPRAIAAVAARLRGQAEGWQHHGPDEVEDLLRRAGDMTEAEVAAAGVSPEWLARLEAERGRRAADRRRPRRWRPLGPCRRRLAVPPAEADVAEVLRRYARAHGPFRPDEVGRADMLWRRRTSRRPPRPWPQPGSWPRASSRGARPGCCDPEVLRQEFAGRR